MWRRMNPAVKLTIRMPCTQCRVRVWMLVLSASLVFISQNFYKQHNKLYNYRHFHYAELPVPVVSVSPLKNFPVASDAWIVTSDRWSEEYISRIVTSGWKVVIAVSGPHNYSRSLENCTVMDSLVLQGLRYKSKNCVTEEDQVRNIGYLYAIEHGAKFIYEINGGQVPVDPSHPGFIQSEHAAAMKLTGCPGKLFAPMGHFSGDDSTKGKDRKYVTCKMRSPTVQHGVTAKGSVDAHSPGLVLADGVYGPYNSMNTFYNREGFWSLVTVKYSGAISQGDLFRGIWAQRLMRLAGQNLGYVSRNTLSLNPRDGHNLKNVKSDLEKLVDLLDSWNCSFSVFWDCVKDLGHLMVREKFWDATSRDVLEAWIHDLTKIRYKQPDILEDHAKYTKSHCMSQAHSTYFNPKVVTNPPWGRKYLVEFCEGSIKNHKWAVSPSFTFDKVLLIVIYNAPHYANLEVVHSIYRDHFPNLLYCGPYVDTSQYVADLKVSFVNATDTYGYFGYECMLRALEMGYQVDGYLVTGDDVLLNFWRMRSLDLQKIWSPSSEEHGFKVDRNNGTSTLAWWNIPVLGKVKVNEAFKEFQDILSGQSPYSNITGLRDSVGKFWRNRCAAGLGDNMIISHAIDTYYIPAGYADVYYNVLQIFRRFDVFLEFALSTAVAGLSVEVPLKLSGFYDWSETRITGALKYYNESMDFLHPVKFKPMFKSEEMRRSYCGKASHTLL